MLQKRNVAHCCLWINSYEPSGCFRWQQRLNGVREELKDDEGCDRTKNVKI